MKDVLNKRKWWRNSIRLRHLFNFLWLFFGFAIFVLKIVRKRVLVIVVVVVVVEVADFVFLFLHFKFRASFLHHLSSPPIWRCKVFDIAETTTTTTAAAKAARPYHVSGHGAKFVGLVLCVDDDVDHGADLRRKDVVRRVQEDTLF